MSTPALPQPQPGHVNATATYPVVPFARLLRVELRKLVDTRAGRWLLIVIAAVIVIPEAIYLGVAHHDQLTFTNAREVGDVGATLFLPVLGVLSVTSEWSQRTGLVSFTLEPHRHRVILAKFCAIVVLGLGFLAFGYLFGALGNELSVLIRGAGSWHTEPSWVPEVILAQLFVMVQGFGFGMLFLNTPTAIVLYYVGRIIIPTLFAVIPGILHSAPWLDFSIPVQNLARHQMSGPKPWLELLSVFAIWVVVPIAIGTRRIARTEIKTA